MQSKNENGTPNPDLACQDVVMESQAHRMCKQFHSQITSLQGGLEPLNPWPRPIIGTIHGKVQSKLLLKHRFGIMPRVAPGRALNPGTLTHFPISFHSNWV
jgi:hypothetical protein